MTKITKYLFSWCKSNYRHLTLFLRGFGGIDELEGTANNMLAYHYTKEELDVVYKLFKEHNRFADPPASQADWKWEIKLIPVKKSNHS